MIRYGHLRRLLENFIRELNFSGWLAVVRLATIFFKRNPQDKAFLILNSLSHFTYFPYRHFLLRLAAKYDSQSKVLLGNHRECELQHSIIIKAYVSEQEKGIILVSFEKELEKIISNDNFYELDKKYYIVFMPSWTGFFSLPLLRLASVTDSKFFVMPVHSDEERKAKDLSFFCETLPFNAASWINEDLYGRVFFERDIDCLIVANFARFKRHWLLFKVLSGLPSSIKLLCVGVPLGKRSAESIRNEAEEYGVSSQVEIVENPPQEELRNYFARAKVFCATSYKEGSFIAVAEALISGTPVVMFKNAKIGTKKLITNDCGALVSSIHQFRSAVMKLLKGADHDGIRKNAKSQVGSRANCNRLNECIRSSCLDDQLDWSNDIEYFYSVRLKFYYHDSGALEKLESDYRYLDSLGYKFK